LDLAGIFQSVQSFSTWLVQEFYWPRSRREKVWWKHRFGGFMSCATAVLGLRREQSSSVELLLGAIDWQSNAKDALVSRMRGHAVTLAADTVLLNVAVHAAEAQRIFGEDSGSSLAAPPRPPRPRKSAARRRADSLPTRQLNFAAFYR
jgi:hypothetical protein